MLFYFDGGELVGVLFILIVLSPVIIVSLLILFLNSRFKKKEGKPNATKD
jgi:hypothetical protein